MENSRLNRLTRVLADNSADDQVLREARTRVGRGVPIGDFKIRPRLGCQSEFVDRLPTVLDPQLKIEDLALARCSVDAVRGRLLEARFEADGHGRGLAAKADIGDEPAFGQIDKREPVGQRRLAVLVGPNHPSSQSGDRKAQGSEHIVKQSVVLLAITAAPGADELDLDRRRIEVHRDTEKRIEALESDAPDMRSDELTQDGEIGSPGPA